MDAVKEVATVPIKVQCPRTHRVQCAAFHGCWRGVRIALDHFRGRCPRWPYSLAHDLRRSKPLKAFTPYTDRVADRSSVSAREIQEVLARIDHKRRPECPTRACLQPRRTSASPTRRKPTVSSRARGLSHRPRASCRSSGGTPRRTRSSQLSAKARSEQPRCFVLNRPTANRRSGASLEGRWSSLGQTANTPSPSPRPYRGRESHKLCSYGPAIPVRASHTSQVEDAQRPGRSPPGGSRRELCGNLGDGAVRRRAALTS